MNRQTYMEVSKSNFKYNIEQIKKYVQEKEVRAVVKANGYGTYINKCLDLIKDFKYVAVACVSEAVELRNIGYTGNIFVLNQPYIEDIDNIIRYNVIVGVSDINFIRALASYDTKVKVHIELETGMGRTGVLERFLDINLVIASNLLLGDITSYLNKHNVLISDTKLSDDKFRELVTKLDKKEISNKIFKDILDDLMESDKSIQEILDEKGLVLVNDKDAVISLVKGVLAENIEMVKQYKDGNIRASKALMGQVMKVSKGSIDPSLANSVLMECLDNYE